MKHISIPEPTLSSSATPEVKLLPLEPIDKEYIAYDFTAAVCNAQWSNNGEYLPCPGNMAALESGAIIPLLEEVIIQGGIMVQQPALQTIPAQPESKFYAIFGKYEPFFVQQGDRFKSVLACLDEALKCDLTFSLEYFDAYGNPQVVPNASWVITYDPAGDYTYADVNLDFLAGQQVQFLLGARDNGDPSEDFGVWIAPHIWRDPKVSHQEHITIITESPPETYSQTPGVIAGWVDMSSAPPYLMESNHPVVVVMFNQDDNTYWWIHTTLTHPYFQMTVTPGTYTICAYGMGVADTPYVSAGYTGQNPSCGKELATVNVAPNQKVDSIVIADWNWSCGWNAFRPQKPADVPIP